MRSCLLAMLILFSLPALADWGRRPSPGSAHLTRVSATDAAHVFTAGVELTGGFPPRLQTSVHAGDDGGRLWSDLSSNLGVSASFDDVSALFFLDAQRGWVSIGQRIIRTTDGGSTWTPSQGFRATALHFLSARVGLAGGDGGALRRSDDGGSSWVPLESPVSTTIRGFFFASELLGWAYAHDEDADSGAPSGAVLLRTVDGGRSWTRGAEVGVGGISAISFRCDGIGWIAGWTKADEQTYEAYLHRSEDGGRTSAAVNVPVQVGALQMFGQNKPINTAMFLAMYWDDALRGELAGIAHVTRLDSGDGPKDIWRVVDFSTMDGGMTWTATKVGDLAMDLFNPPSSDGTFAAGALVDAMNGWLVGADGEVRARERLCVTTADCDRAGYVCDGESRCVRAGPPECIPSCEPDEELVDGACVSREDPPGNGGGGNSCGGDSDPEGTIEATGCGCATGSAGLLVWIALGAALPRRRA